MVKLQPTHRQIPQQIVQTLVALGVAQCRVQQHFASIRIDP